MWNDMWNDLKKSSIWFKLLLIFLISAGLDSLYYHSHEKHCQCFENHVVIDKNLNEN